MEILLEIAKINGIVADEVEKFGWMPQFDKWKLMTLPLDQYKTDVIKYAHLLSNLYWYNMESGVWKFDTYRTGWRQLKKMKTTQKLHVKKLFCGQYGFLNCLLSIL